ncbi:hypothetical protein Tco_1183880 [Tanacetum coccineum]
MSASGVKNINIMHGHVHPKQARSAMIICPKQSDRYRERVRAFIMGETVTDTTEVIRSPHWGKSASKAKVFTPLTKTPKEILAMDNVNFPPPTSDGRDSGEAKHEQVFMTITKIEVITQMIAIILRSRIEEAVAFRQCSSGKDIM